MKFPINVSSRKFLKISLTTMAATHFISGVTSSSKMESVGPRLTARPGKAGQTAIKGLTQLAPGGGHCRNFYVPERAALGGFSDGATYTLSLGVSNGDLFSHLIVYSPGYIAGKAPIVGKPRIYKSHGTKDHTLALEVSRDNVVPAFRKAGYDVVYN